MAYTIVLFDDFNDNSIDTAKWDETDPASVIAETSSTLQISRALSTQLRFVNKLQSDASITSGVAVVQSDFTWTTDSADESLMMFVLYVDDSNYATISSRATGGVYRLIIVDGGSTVYNLETAIAKNKSVKITYDITSKDIKFWYWGGASWTQMGTTQNVDIGSTVKMVFSVESGTTQTGANPGIWDNAYFISGEDYSVNPPTSTSTTSTSSSTTTTTTTTSTSTSSSTSTSTTSTSSSTTTTTSTSTTSTSSSTSTTSTSSSTSSSTSTSTTSTSSSTSTSTTSTSSSTTTTTSTSTTSTSSSTSSSTSTTTSTSSSTSSSTTSSTSTSSSTTSSTSTSTSTTSTSSSTSTSTSTTTTFPFAIRVERTGTQINSGFRVEDAIYLPN